MPFDLTGPQTYAAGLDGVSLLILLFPSQLGECDKQVADRQVAGITDPRS